MGGGMKRGSGRGRRLDFLPSSSSSFPPWVPPFCPELSVREFLSDRRRVTMTEGLRSMLVMSWSVGRCGQPVPRIECSLSGEDEDERGSGLRTGTDTGMTRGIMLSSRGRLALWPPESLSMVPRRGAGLWGLQGLWGCSCLTTCGGSDSISEAFWASVTRLTSWETLSFLHVL